MDVQISFHNSAFNSFGYTPRSRLARSYNTSIFKFLRNCYAVLHRGYPILHSYQQCTSLPISSHLCQHLLFSVLLIVAVLMGVRYCLVVVLVCIFLMISEVKHFFMCSLAICISSLEKCLFKSLPIFESVSICYINFTHHSSFHLRLSFCNNFPSA